MSMTTETLPNKSKKKAEILPARWVYISFHAAKVGEWKAGYHGTRYGESHYESWVVFGTLAEAKRKAPAVWEHIRAGRNLRLENTDFYPNNYKPRSRQLIEAGRFTV
jgi:hypothetical protein